MALLDFFSSEDMQLKPFVKLSNSNTNPSIF